MIELKYVTCPVCKGHDWSSISSGEDDKIKLLCRCGESSYSKWQKVNVPYPDVTINGELFKELSEEKEMMFEGDGVDVEIKYYDESGRDDEIRYNTTEVHYLHESFDGNDSVAVESDIHGTGGTIPVASIKSINVVTSKQLVSSHYELIK